MGFFAIQDIPCRADIICFKMETASDGPYNFDSYFVYDLQQIAKENSTLTKAYTVGPFYNHYPVKREDVLNYANNYGFNKLIIKPEEFAFSCRGWICETDFNVSDERIEYNHSKESYVLVVGCGNKSRTENPKYCEGIGLTAEDATSACLDRCSLIVAH